jgi:hypothetical protein
MPDKPEQGLKVSPLKLNQGLGQLDAWNEETIKCRAEKGLGEGPASVLQHVAVDHSHAHPAGLGPRFQPDPTAAARPPHPVPERPEQEPAQVRLEMGRGCRSLHHDGEINQGTGLSVLVDIGELMGEIGVPVYTYRNFPRKPGLTVEQSLAGLGTKGLFAEIGVQVPDSLIMDCDRLCCSLCLLENDASIISPDVLADDRAKFDQTGDLKYVDKAHRRGKVGWDVGKHIAVIPHYRRPHMALVWTGPGRRVPRIVPRKGSVVHREMVENLPSGFGG